MQYALSNALMRVASLYFEGLGTPVSLGLKLRLDNGLWEEISDMSPDPRTYTDPVAFGLDHAACGFLKKLKQLPTGIDKKAAAVEKWWQGERDCYRSNLRLACHLPLNKGARNEAVHSYLMDARKVIRGWIGNKPPELLAGRFGPGATFSDRGGDSTVPDKMSADPSMTSDAVWYLPQWYGTQWGAAVAQRQGKVSVVRGNRFTTVPKNARTDRSIASEPSINMFYQLALGSSLRSRLRATSGWDLDIAQETHRRVACESSRTREFATLDLSNASDTVSRSLVRILMPHLWYEQLDDLRSKATYIENRWVVLEKFSSMGNGFTFELETLLFAALACVASQRCGYHGLLGSDVFVFGDDIIVKNDVAPLLRSVLEYCGLKLNVEKSYFGDEPFRESCGGDYFAGQPVRPFFVKDDPNDPQGWIGIANGLAAMADQIPSDGADRLRRAWFSCLDQLPSNIRRCRGPRVLGDAVIHDDESRWETRWKHSIRYIKAYVPDRYRIKRYDWYAGEVVLACATYMLGGSDIGGVIPRDGLLSYKVGWIPYS